MAAFRKTRASKRRPTPSGSDIALPPGGNGNGDGSGWRAPPGNGNGNGDGDGNGNGNGNGNGGDVPDKDDSCGCEYEVWDCQGGPIEVMVDSEGCPIDQSYCKVQIGPAAVTAIAAGATAVITITTNDFSKAKVRGMVMQASDPAAVLGADWLNQLGVSGIRIQGIENIDGEIPATRFREDATGSNVGTGQAYRGNLGSSGGDALITVINRSAATTLNVWVALDVNAVR